MMKQFLFILLSLSFYMASYAQQSYETYCGNVFKEGDALVMGCLPQNTAKYSCVKCEFTDAYNKVRYEAVAGGNLPLSKVILKEIIRPQTTTMFYNKAVVFVVESEKMPGRKLFVEIDKAIKRGEIAVVLPEKPLIDSCPELTAELMFACCVRVNKLKIDDSVVFNYIYMIDSKLGKECYRDKFKFQKIKEEYKNRLEQAMKSIDFKTVYRVNVNANRKEYDFQRKGYSLVYSFPVGKTLQNGIPCNGFNLMSNDEQPFFLPLDPETADLYEKRSKGNSKNGYATSLVYGTLYVQLQDKYIELPKGKYEIVDVERQYRSTVIGVQVKGMEVYDNPCFRYNLIGVSLFE